ncbi:MAG: response regulator [Melioribacteraceae bacterium]
MIRNKILVIEDEKNLNDNIVTLLTESGYEVKSAFDGLKGIYLAKEFNPDLILCDIAMPEIDGYEVLKNLLEDHSFPLVPFIFLTAKVEREDLRRGMELGADDYIFKPFKAADLLNSVKTRLKKHEIIISKLKISPDEKNNITKKYAIDDKIFIDSSSNPIYLKISEIKSIVADNQYTILNSSNNKKYFLRKTIKSWEEVLPAKSFLRIHRSTIINSEYISRIEKWYNGQFRVYLREQQEPLMISKRYSKILRNNL